jgi:23S rRNA pseudouridine1911/1915/1917 synthase
MAATAGQERPLGDWVVPEAAAGERLVDHAHRHLGVVVRRAVGPLITASELLVDGRPGRIAEPITAGALLRLRDGALGRLRAERRTVEPADRPIEVLHEDVDLLVVDKPAGMHVHPMGRYRDDTLIGALLWWAGARPHHPWSAFRPLPVHRLDRPTSGLLFIATDPVVQDRLQAGLVDGTVTRTYRALVDGHVAEDAGVIDLPLGRDPTRDRRRGPVAVADGGQHARTAWTVLEHRVGQTLLDVTLGTGRTHQIRAHMAARGHPVAGDELYGSTTSAPSDGGIHLRAWVLRTAHPRDGRPLEVTATLPGWATG